MNINLVVTFIVLLVFALIGLSARQFNKSDENIEGLLLANRDASSLSVGASLFTLIGAGELITLSTLAFLFGFDGVFLFLGYSIAFVFVGFMANRIRSLPEAAESNGLVDLATKAISPQFGFACFLISFAAFFALLMLQFSAIGAFLPEATGQDRSLIIIMIGVTVFIYLAMGGLKSVFRTDIFQAFFMILFMLIAIALINSDSVSIGNQEFTSAGFDLTWGLTISGFFVGICSADVWQRMLAARSDRAARNGFLWGAATLFIYGILICMLGIAVATLSPNLNPDQAFFEAMRIALPGEMQALAIALMLAALVSTADTELFVLSSMTDSMLKQFDIGSKATHRTRLTVILALISLAAIFGAIFFGDLIMIYTWLLFTLICLSPVLWATLLKYTPDSQIAFYAVILNILIFLIMAWNGMVTIDNIYLLLIPTLIVQVGAKFFQPKLLED